MNCFYLSKKTNYFACLLNVMGTFAWMFLLFIIYIYHFHQLMDSTGANNYLYLIQNSTATSESTGAINSVQANNDYPGEFIRVEGFAKFFGQSFIGVVSVWHVIISVFILATSCYVIKTILSLSSIIFAYKSKSILYIHLSVLEIFCPMFGGIYGIYIAEKNKKIIEPRHIFPLFWLKFKIKNLVSNIYSDNKYKSF